MESKAKVTKAKEAIEQAKGNVVPKAETNEVQHGKRKNRPIKEISENDFDKLHIFLLRKQNVDLEINDVVKQIQLNQRTNQILQQEVVQKKIKKQQLDKEYDKFIDDLKQRTGIDVRHKSIDYVTRQVYDVNELAQLRAGGVTVKEEK